MWLLKTDTRYLQFISLGNSILGNDPSALPYGNGYKATLYCLDKCCYLDEYIPVGSVSDIIILEEWHIHHVTYKSKRNILTNYNSLIEWGRTSMMAYYYVSNLEVVHNTSHLKEDSVRECGALEFTYSYKCPVMANEFIINCGWDGKRSEGLVSILNRTLKNEPGQ